MENQKVRESSLRLSTVATTTRQTPKTDFGSIMRNGLIRTGDVVLQGMQVAAPFVPGGAIISAALAGATNAISGGSVGGGGGGGYGAAPDGIGVGGGGAVYGSTASGLTGHTGGVGGSVGGGTGVAPGNYNNGTLAIPGARPGYGTDLNQPASNFAGSYGGGVAGAGAGPSDAFNQMMTATRQMAEFQASFNLQYLQLQEKIQIDTRQFNLVSNIMKTKHDAAKNALNNVR
jgi:hypothetical protein